ncbi:single-stranded DNA-binding protein, partial [Persicitalea sp.]|uniref:single-stranded DNA-binding protein n=1 Tax=Persicitalea sp. TaxID=3100273 RepID=UPI00359472DC
KGNQVYVEGKIRTENWTDKEGQARTSISILANSMTMLGSSGLGSGGYDEPGESAKSGVTEPAAASSSNAPAPTNAPKADDPVPPALASDGDDDDLPF